MIRSVVIVDDEPADRMIAARAIRRAGFDPQIFEFPDGQQALDFFQADGGSLDAVPSPALVLVDINMPRMGGFELIARLCPLIDRSSTPSEWGLVMMLTSSSNPRDRARADEASCVCDYALKPLTAERFRALVIQHFGESAVPAGPK